MQLKDCCRKKTNLDYEIFNLGTGKGVSVLEMIKAFEKSTGVKINYRITGRREGDVPMVWADTTLANTELGLESRYTFGRYSSLSLEVGAIFQE